MAGRRKAALAIGGIGLVGALIAYLLTRGKAAPEGPAASVKIDVLDANGNPVPAPLTLNEGVTYTVMATVTNKTIIDGEPGEADLETWVSAAADMTELIPSDIFPQYYLPGAIMYFSSPLSIPMGLAGATGGIVATVFDLSNNQLASAIKSLVVRESPLPADGLYGVVTDAETGAPLESVWVTIAAPYEQAVITDANGYYTFPDLAPGSYTVYFNKEGYLVKRVELTFTQAPHQLNVELSAPATGEDYFISCEVPTQVAQYEEFWASQKVFLTAREGLLFNFQLVARTTAHNAHPIQLKQILPLVSDGFYESSGLASWGQEPFPVSLTDIGIYKVISSCSVIQCEIVEIPPYGQTIRTWGQWVTLWQVDTGKTIEVV